MRYCKPVAGISLEETARRLVHLAHDTDEHVVARINGVWVKAKPLQEPHWWSDRYREMARSIVELVRTVIRRRLAEYRYLPEFRDRATSERFKAQARATELDYVCRA